ncbi:methyltransferase-like protein 23 isoform X4 [Anabas testudineus]|uniref:Methyltransferase like 23 n=2 Tax=Anabas testudineus TaxID=64144 RepID=A0A3Q1J3Q6_ANATE|nr:methyltransferase-like protein 23 isoform X4 [Anabas testudineus]
MDHKGADTPSIAYKVFTFEESKKNTQESLSVSIPEVLDPQYGMYVWPCAVVLAQYLWTQREELRGKTVLELGAGVSLPGVVAAKCGAKVILSDSTKTPLCLENCRRSCEANSLHDVVVMGIIWGEISPDLVLLPKLDIILGSDVFYEPQDFEDVLVTVAFLLRKNPRAQFWTTYQERSADWSIEALLYRWKLNCVEVPLETFDANKSELAGSNLPGRHIIQMIVITLKTEDVGL